MSKKKYISRNNLENACLKRFAYQSKRGFSMAEVIISSFVLSVGIVAMLNLISGSINNSIDSRDEVVAAQLAQEGEELIRNIRDNNYANSRTYGAGIVNGNTCVDYLTPTNTGAAPACVVVGSYALYFDTTNLKYTQTSGGNSATKFSRKITISDSVLPQPAGKQVTSKVWWKSTEPGTCDLVNKCITSSSLLTDWH
jgi:Tfp pilus assembly protein PilV